MTYTYLCFFFFFFNDTATTEIYTLSLHDALPISRASGGAPGGPRDRAPARVPRDRRPRNPGRRPRPRCPPRLPRALRSPAPPGRARARPPRAGYGRCCRCRPAGFVSCSVPRSWSKPTRGPAQLTELQRAFADQAGRPLRAINDGRRRRVSQNAPVQHEQGPRLDRRREILCDGFRTRRRRTPGQVSRSGRHRLPQRPHQTGHPAMRCPAHGDPAFRAPQHVRQPAAPSREYQRERPGPEGARQRARGLTEREALRLRHVAVGDQQQDRLVGPPALQACHRLDVRAPRPRTQAIHRFRRIGDQPALMEMRHHPRKGGRHFLVRPEGNAAHRSSRASASATRKSSAVVTLRLYAESGTTSTGKPARSHSSASSVGAASPFASPAYARSIIARGKPCGVCARQRRFRGTVFVIRSCSTSLTVSETGIAATAPTPRRALAITPSIVSRVTNGRAASWTSTTVACGGSAPRPAPTDWARVAPPATSANPSPPSLPSHSGGRASDPAGPTPNTCPPSRGGLDGRNPTSRNRTARKGPEAC